MTRLIDADAIDKRYVPIAPVIDWGTVHYEWVAFIDDINELPTIDAVTVIRCKDCKYYDYEELGHRCVYDQYVETGEEFCSWAERKESS